MHLWAIFKSFIYFKTILHLFRNINRTAQNADIALFKQVPTVVYC